VLSIYWRPLRQLAIKFNAAVNKPDDDQSSDFDMVTSPIYPWVIQEPGCSLEYNGKQVGIDTIRISNLSSSDPPQQIRHPYTKNQSECQDIDRQENNTELFQAHSFLEQQLLPSSHPRAVSGISDQLSNAEYRSLEDSLMAANWGEQFDIDWWNSGNEWECPAPSSAADH